MRLLIAVTMILLMTSSGTAGSRLKDIAFLNAAKENLLVGYGLVVGLQGTGDGLRNSPFTEQSLKAMLQRMGIAAGTNAARSKNLAAVVVTGKLPAYAEVGARLDITVSSIGDASSLAGGTLVMTPLYGADQNAYAAAQGAVIVSGFQAEGQAETITRGVPTAGRIPNGATVEKSLPDKLSDVRILKLQLRNPDFSTAIKIADTINEFSARRYGRRVAREKDASTIVLTRPNKVSTARFFAEIEGLEVETDAVARVVIDEKTGTIVIGNDVKISRVAVSHGTLTVQVTELPKIVQPQPFSDGETAVEPNTEVNVFQGDGRIGVVGGTNLQELIRGLNQLGVNPIDIISILQTIKSAGALQAELILQ